MNHLRKNKNKKKIFIYNKMEIEGYSRKQHENFFNYTDDQLAEKQLALKTMRELWPDVPTYYAEIVYDMCKNKTQEEIDKIKEKVEKEPFKYSKNKKLEN
jgi:uncharacterized Fe-S cluster-containing radical SAM superfamily protein